MALALAMTLDRLHLGLRLATDVGVALVLLLTLAPHGLTGSSSRLLMALGIAGRPRSGC